MIRTVFAAKSLSAAAYKASAFSFIALAAVCQLQCLSTIFL